MVPTEPLQLDEIVEPAHAAVLPDSNTLLEEDDFKRHERKAHIQELIQDIGERKKYAGRIFWLLAAWLICMFLLLVLQGFFSPSKLFQLDDSVLLAVIGGTTLNVIGIFLVVTRYLFPQRPPIRKY